MEFSESGETGEDGKSDGVRRGKLGRAGAVLGANGRGNLAL